MPKKDIRAISASEAAELNKKNDRLRAGELALEVLKWLDEEGDSNGRCVDNRCRSAPCVPGCQLSAALKLAGIKK